jgi:hypothetical protein
MLMIISQKENVSVGEDGVKLEYLYIADEN